MPFNGMWTERAKIQATDKANSAQFGFSLDLDGDLLVVVHMDQIAIKGRLMFLHAQIIVGVKKPNSQHQMILLAMTFFGYILSIERSNVVKGSIFILGVPRTGTSLVSELCYRSDKVYVGSELEQADIFNARGYWEHLPLKDFHNRLVTEGCHTTALIPPSPQQLKQLAQQPSWYTEAQELIDVVNRGTTTTTPVWLLKHPWLTFLLPFWQEIKTIPNAVYILCFRNPMSAAFSQKKFFEKRILKTEHSINNFPLSAAFLLWQVHMITALRSIQDKPKLFMEYEDTVNNPQKASQKIHRFLYESFGIEGDLNRMTEVIEPTLQHYQSTDFMSVAEASKEQKNLYQLLKQLVNDPQLPINFADIELPYNWHEQLLTLQFWYAQQMLPKTPA